MNAGPGLTLLLVVLQNAILLSLTVGVFWTGVLAMRGFGRRRSFSLSPLGIARPANGFRNAVLLGLAVGVGALLASFPLNALSAYLLEVAGYPTGPNAQQPFIRSLESFVSRKPSVAVPAVFLVVVVVGPAVEELVFRGAIYGGLYNLVRVITGRSVAYGRTRAGDKIAFVLAVTLSSALFATLHLEPGIFPTIFVLAASLCWLLRRTGSLLPPFVAHATFNSFATALVVLGGLGILPSQT